MLGCRLLLFALILLFGWTAGAQQMPCPFEYPDTPVNRSRGVVGCSLQCDQKLTCPGQQAIEPQKLPSAMAPGNAVNESGTCPEGKNWDSRRKTCVVCAAGASWDAKRSTCSCGAGRFVDPKNKALRQLSRKLGLGKREVPVHSQLEIHVGGKVLLAQAAGLQDRQRLGCRKQALCGSEAAEAEGVVRDG